MRLIGQTISALLEALSNINREKIMMIKPTGKLAFVCAFTFLLISTGIDARAEKNLYQRLGGYDGIAASVDDFFGRLIGDKMYGRFFNGMADDRKKIARQLTVDFICAAAGGPCVYNGRDMVRTHKGMKITDAEWDKSIVHLKATLNALKVPATEQKDVLAMIGNLRGDIVNR